MLFVNKVFITNKVGDIKGDNELIKKFVKSKIGSKSQKLAKLRKRLSKNGNLPNFKGKKNRSSFLTFKARITFNFL